jgi:putative ABC transport system permease protein
MNLLWTMRLAFSALMRNRSRSLLTMLGVIIGVGAVITTIAIGSGARIAVASQINSLGSNMVVVLPGSVTTTGARSGSGGASTLTPADGIAIATLPGVAAVSPQVSVRAQVVSSGNNWQTSVTGVSPSYTYIRSWPMAQGLFFSQSDITSASKVAILGQTVVTNLYPNGNSPLGSTIFVRGVPFIVVGVLSPKGQSGLGQDQDDTVLVPFSSAMERLTGQTTVSSLMVSATDAAQVENVQTEITALLEQRHHIVPPQQDDFNVRNLQDIAAAASSTATVMEFLLAGVAAVSLLVGGIGIMNIMLVSVTERTREIGLRMAVGARAGAILLQFLVEAFVLSTIGGLIGVLLGVGASSIISVFSHWPTVIPISSVAIAVVFSAFVGVFFSYYPARKAAHLNPIEALRFE